MRNGSVGFWAKVLAICVAVFLVTTGCASLVSRSSYPVEITSDPDRADFVILDGEGETIHEGVTPATITLEAGNGYFSGADYTVMFAKPGYAVHTAEMKRGIDGWYIVGNIFIGGLIGWLIVDPITGAMWTLPKEVTVTLSPAASSLDGSEQLHITSLEDIPHDLRAQMVRVR